MLKKRHIFCIGTIIGLLSAGTSAVADHSAMFQSKYLGLNLKTERKSFGFASALGLRLGKTTGLKANLTSGNTGRPGLQTSGSKLVLTGFQNSNKDWKLQPFVTAGVGIGYFDGKTIDASAQAFQNTDFEQTGLIYQVGGGLQYKLDRDLALSGGYRFIGSEDIEFDNTETSYENHEFRLGIDYDLPIGWDIKE